MGCSKRQELVPLPIRPEPPINYGLYEYKTQTGKEKVGISPEGLEYILDLESYITRLQSAPCWDNP